MAVNEIKFTKEIFTYFLNVFRKTGSNRVLEQSKKHKSDKLKLVYIREKNVLPLRIAVPWSDIYFEWKMNELN